MISPRLRGRLILSRRLKGCGRFTESRASGDGLLRLYDALLFKQGVDTARLEQVDQLCR
jgi:hypothetical protein